MSLFELKIISAILIFGMAIIAGWVPFQKRLSQHHGFSFPAGEALASGVFLGAGLMHMLGDASRAFEAAHVVYPLPFLLAGVVFLFLLWLEHLGREFHEHKGADSAALAVLAMVMLSIHSLLAGAAIGLSGNLSVFIVLLIAVLAHKWAAGFSLAVQINRSILRMPATLFLYSVFAFMTPIGILFGDEVMQHLQLYPLLQPIFLSLAAGTFLYLGTLHGLKRAVMIDRCCNLLHFSYVIAGFTLMAVVAIWT